MIFHIVTLFPEVFPGYLKSSILGRAMKNKKISVKFYNPRDYTKDKHRRVDLRPYGGGPGMVLAAEPILKAVSVARKNKKQKTISKYKIIIFNAGGKNFTNKYADNWLKNYTDIILICGRYEGIDARVKKALRAEEISIGEYILTGGEIPAMAVIDAMTRRLPGVLGSDESVEERRIASHEVYTRPEEIKWEGKKYRAPGVLLSGHHKNIGDWRWERGESK